MTPYILAVLSAAYFAAAIWGTVSGRRRQAARAWLIVAVIFGMVSAWLFRRG
jgi:hypothetical protein